MGTYWYAVNDDLRQYAFVASYGLPSRERVLADANAMCAELGLGPWLGHFRLVSDGEAEFEEGIVPSYENVSEPCSECGRRAHWRVRTSRFKTDRCRSCLEKAGHGYLFRVPVDADKVLAFFDGDAKRAEELLTVCEER